MNKPYFDTLAGMRGVAAGMVVMYHLMPLVFVSGPYAVDLFWILSGVVTDRTFKDASAGAFLGSRFWRLYPLYLLGSVIGAVAGVSLWGRASVAELPAAVLFIPNFVHMPAYPLDPPAWTLSIEAILYVGFAFIRSTPAVVFICLFALWGVVRTHCGWSLECFLARAFFEFNLGVLLYRCRVDRKLPGAWVLLGVLALVLACRQCVAPILVVGVVLPALVWWGMHARPVRGSWMMTKLGAASFPVYILHGPLIGVFMAAHANFAWFVKIVPWLAGLLALYAGRKRVQNALAKRIGDAVVV